MLPIVAKVNLFAISKRMSFYYAKVPIKSGNIGKIARRFFIQFYYKCYKNVILSNVFLTCE